MRARLFTYPMRLRLLLGIAAATLLLWGLAAPAFAQAKAKAGGAQATAGDVHVQYVDCSQVQAAFASQNNSGNAISVSQGQYNFGKATTQIAQDLDISQSQVNACLGNIGSGNPPESTTAETTSETKAPENTTSETTTTETTGDLNSPKGVVPGTLSGSKLPNTGGMPLPGAILGFAMVAAGILSAGAIVRRSR